MTDQALIDEYAATNGISNDDARKMLVEVPKMNVMKQVDPLHVVVRFGSGIPGDIQARSLLEFERILRRNSPGQWIEVFKEIMGDDSKLRNLMTPEQRDKL